MNDFLNNRCLNSPRQIFILEFIDCLLSQKNEQITKFTTDKTTYQFPKSWNRLTENQNNHAVLFNYFRQIKDIKIQSLITHGKEAALIIDCEFNNKSNAFICIVFIFQRAGNSKISSVQCFENQLSN